ncbi:MAG TPA: hypothetical protein VHE35_36980 [Kofleriaceae bacterium]|nr:hypothetical protein [Kofleriaceae bacterium]
MTFAAASAAAALVAVAVPAAAHADEPATQPSTQPTAPPMAPPEAGPTGPTWQHRHGLTLEAGIGFGSFRGSSTPALYGTQKSLGGPDLGVGWFLNRRLALGVRFASVAHRHYTGDFLALGFAGPAAQLWLAPYAWAGGGAGLALVDDGGWRTGLALDARIGLSFHTDSRHTFNASVEVTPGFAGGSIYTGVAIVAGYQLL